ncbi:peptidylprolyl isomerase [Gammaproteobacteria bacterium]|nr:peptidylprolyl isomerase [Gammaproteobacteria bacterium]
MTYRFNKIYSFYHKSQNSPTIITLLIMLLFVFTITPLTSVSSQLYNPSGQGIVAVVNTDIISQFDFTDRTRLIIFSAGLPNNKKTIKRISPQILQGLINDQLKLQETKRLGIKIKQDELRDTIAKIEKMNGMAKGGMRILMKEKGINFRAFERQVEAQTAWKKAVVKQVMSTIKIDDETVDEAIAELESNKGKPEYNVAEIFFPFEPKKSKEEINKIALRLYTQLQQGANFTALARAFSQSASSAKGGNLGWIRDNQIEKNLSNIMIKMKKNSTSKPFKGEDGYYILKLLDKRLSSGVAREKLRITLQQLFLPLRQNTSTKKAYFIAEQAKNISIETKTCSDLSKKGKELGSKQSGRVEVEDISQLPNNIRNVVEKIELSKASKPIKMSSGFLIIMVCKRTGGDIMKNMRAQIKNMLLQRRAILVDRRMLRDIRRTAFLDIRQ